MLLFAAAEAMFFAGLVSAFTIVRAGTPGGVWPPPGQPRLPFAETALNTGALLLSAAVLIWAHRRFRRSPELARWPLLTAMILGALFVTLQGVEWVGMLRQGLTLTSSTLGSFFYLVVGAHALHAVAAVGGLAYVFIRLLQGRLEPSHFFAAQVFWYFVVGLWPVLYLRVYL
ncbi:MAG: cytochrome c oxidase subunit 3 [Deltaproteobacteria bacterium]|nr:cytochrome c oxidase subunit 3 [Deltaproteobacteria bacterium]